MTNNNGSLSTLTNQIVINAFANAAGALGQSDPWALMARANVSLASLVEDRNGPYLGPDLALLPNLTTEEMDAVGGALARLMAAQPTDGGPHTRPTATGFLCRQPELQTVALEPPSGQRIGALLPGAPPVAGTMASIWNRYGGLLTTVGNRLRIDPVPAAAVLAVESGGRAFGASGRMIIRFEVHIFHDRWGRDHPDEFALHFRFDPAHPSDGNQHEWRPEPGQPWLPVHASQEMEWNAFGFARVFCSDRAAKLSISMGAAQIMGFNFATIGYPDVDAMFDAFENSERNHILGFFDFVQANPLQIQALQENNLRTFATQYNGRGQEDIYAPRMQNAMTTLAGLLAAPRPAAVGAPATPSKPTPAGIAAPQQLPQPTPNAKLKDIDPKLYEYWREHIREGFEQNSEMFDRILDAFMEPYYTTVWMYRVIFGVGLLAFVAAIALSVWSGQPLFGLVFGGMSVAAFLAFFFNRPLQALEENLHFITWLGIIYNTYWTSLANMSDEKTVQDELRRSTADAIKELDRLLDKHATLSSRRPQAQ